MIIYKKCSKCGKEKNITGFYSCKGGKYGVRAKCKECHNEESKEYITRNEALYEQYKEYQRSEEGKEKARKRYAKRVEKAQGLKKENEELKKENEELKVYLHKLKVTLDKISKSIEL